MTYAVSNIHGCYDKWLRLLKLIDFGKKDVMFVLGDTVDIGDSPLEVLKDFTYSDNIWHVCGEHDIAAYRMLDGFRSMLADGEKPDAKYIGDMQKWIADGGQVTFDAFRELDPDMQEGILDYLGDMPYFEETKVGGEHYIFIHSGISGFVAGTDPDDYGEEAFFGDNPVRKIKGMTVICGHVPTTENFAKDGKIYHGDGFIAIDCGAGRGGQLGCLRLEDGMEFYV